MGTLDADEEWYGGLVRAAVARLARDPDVPRAIVVRSTLLPGTAVAIARAARAIDPRVRSRYNPEFTREATAVSDFLAPDRIVIGVDDHARRRRRRSRTTCAALYAPLEAPVVVTDLTSAETIKIASNVFLAAKITFANELARLCAATGADVRPSWTAWAWTSASGAASCRRVRASAAPASRRRRARCRELAARLRRATRR